MAIKVDDVALLFYSRGGKVETGNEESCKRLQDEGLIDAHGMLLELGKTVLANYKKKFSEASKGIPFEKRSWFGMELRKRLIVESDGQWKTASYMKKEILTNGNALFVAKFLPWVDPKIVEKGDLGLRKKIPLLWGRMQGIIEFFPHTYQINPPEPFAVQIIWLADELQKEFIALSASYFDVVQQKFPSATLWHKPDAYREPFFVKVKNQGVKGVVAILAPIETKMARPKPREGWRTDDGMQSDAMPAIQAEEGSSI